EILWLFDVTGGIAGDPDRGSRADFAPRPLRDGEAAGEVEIAEERDHLVAAGVGDVVAVAAGADERPRAGDQPAAPRAPARAADGLAVSRAPAMAPEADGHDRNRALLAPRPREILVETPGERAGVGKTGQRIAAAGHVYLIGRSPPILSDAAEFDAGGQARN